MKAMWPSAESITKRESCGRSKCRHKEFVSSYDDGRDLNGDWYRVLEAPPK